MDGWRRGKLQLYGPGSISHNEHLKSPSSPVCQCSLAHLEQCGHPADHAPPQPELWSLCVSTPRFSSFSGEGLEGFAVFQPHGGTLWFNCPCWSSTTVHPQPSLVTGGLCGDAQDCPCDQEKVLVYIEQLV